MRVRSGKAVELPDGNDRESRLVGIGHEAVQFWPPVLRTGGAGLHLLAGGLPGTPLAGVRAIHYLRAGATFD